jgi:hypothetical protein
VPKARDALGWHVSVYWKDDKQFYHGQVAEFDASSGKHKVCVSGGGRASGMCTHRAVMKQGVGGLQRWAT